MNLHVYLRFPVKMWKVCPGFSLLPMVKVQEERDKLRKKSLSKKEPALEDLENSQPIQISCSGNRAKGLWLRIHSAISAEARNRDGVIQEEIRGELLCLMMWTPMTSTEDQQGFQEFHSSRWKGQKWDEIKEEWLWGQRRWSHCPGGLRGQGFHPGGPWGGGCCPSRAQRTKQ